MADPPTPNRPHPPTPTPLPSAESFSSPSNRDHIYVSNWLASLPATSRNSSNIAAATTVEQRLMSPPPTSPQPLVLQVQTTTTRETSVILPATDNTQSNMDVDAEGGGGSPYAGDEDDYEGAVPSLHNIPELSTDNGTDDSSRGAFSNDNRSQIYGNSQSQSSSQRHRRRNNLGPPQTGSARLLQQLQSSRIGRGTAPSGGGLRRGYHSRQPSQSSENSSPQITTTGTRKRAISNPASQTSNNNITTNGDEKETPTKKRKIDVDGPEIIETILNSVAVNSNRNGGGKGNGGRRGGVMRLLQVSMRSDGKVKVMQEEEVKRLAPRVYKAWKQLQ